jgi:predicted Zn finger-like uncharacterized protein
MDIKCERCGSEYEFEDERVTETGVTVKCSNCGHLFKVRKKSFVLTEPVPQQEGEPAPAEKNWMVRKADGSVLSFKELTTLQKWIVERRVERDDEISKSGETWKRLGSIAELSSFFQVVDQASGRPSFAEETQQQSIEALGQERSTQPLPAATPQEPSPQPPEPPEPITGPAASAGPQASAPPPAASTPPPAASTPPPAASAPPPAASAPPPAASAPPPATSAPPPATSANAMAGPPAVASAEAGEPDSWGDLAFAAADEDDVVEKWKRRGRRKWYFIVPLLLIAAGVGAFYLLAPERFMGLVQQVIGEPEPSLSKLARTQFEQGRQHFFKDSAAELEAAIQDLSSAVDEAKGRFPQAMGLLAEVYVTRAERAGRAAAAAGDRLAALQAEREQIAAAAEPGAETRAQLKALDEKKQALEQQQAALAEQRQHDLTEAKRLIDAAREQAPEAFAPLRALADYLRVKGADRAQIEVPLAEAGRKKADDPVLVYIDGAAFATDEAALDTAVRKLGRAIELQAKAGGPDLLRARLALARVLARLDRPAEARAQLERILATTADHELAMALLERLPAEQPEAADDAAAEGAEGAEGDGAAANGAGADVAASDSGEEDSDQPAAGDKTDKGEQDKPAQPAGYDGWVSRADRLQRAGRARPALKAYERALEHKPGDVEALTGKGLCLLDMGHDGAAVAAFRRALRANPRYGVAIIGLAEAYKYRRDNDKAIEYYKRYLEVLPHGPEAAVARSNLEQLGQ